MIAIGTDVLVRSLKRRGVVIEALKAGAYRVQVGALAITAREADLEVAAPSRKTRRPPSAVSEATRSGESQASRTSEPASIDLHGLTVDDARNRVAGYISRAILAGHEHVEIIHGIGTGRLKAAVTKDLRALAAVRAVKPHPTNPGISVVYF